MAQTYQIPFDFSEWNRTDAKIQRFLEANFPDGVAYAISRPEYWRIYRRAKAHEMDVTEYLRVLGFAYDKARTWERYRNFRNKKELCEAIRKEYGKKSISYIHNKYFYPNVLHFARQEKQSVREFLENNGFSYDDRHNIGAHWEEQTLIEELERAYPDKVIDRTAHLWFARPLQNAAARYGVTVESYVRYLGFRFSIIRDDDLEVIRFQGIFLGEFPDGVVTNISKYDWYNEFRALCARLRVTPAELVESIGFEYQHAQRPPETAAKTEDSLRVDVANWVEEHGLSNMRSWPMYKDIRKYASQRNMKPMQYVQGLIGQDAAERTEDGLRLDVANWIKEHGLSDMRSWPMYRELRKYANKQKLTAPQYVQLVIKEYELEV